MNPCASTDPVQACEEILRQSILDNQARNICPSEITVARRLLARGAELADAYQEIHQKLGRDPQALRSFFQCVVFDTVVCWNPDELRQARASRKALLDVNQQIAQEAAKLAELLRQRTDLNERSGFSTETHHHICDLIETAAQQNGHFQSWVRKPLANLRHQFDLKYWPPLHDIVQVLALDAERAEPTPNDPLTAVGTASQRTTNADFVRTFLAAIDDNRRRTFGLIPNDFGLTDGAVASLATCLLDLPADAPLTADYVKGLRWRQRNAAAK